MALALRKRYPSIRNNCDVSYRINSDGSLTLRIDPIQGEYNDVNIDLVNNSIIGYISSNKGFSKIRLPRVPEYMDVEDIAQLVGECDKFKREVLSL